MSEHAAIWALPGEHIVDVPIPKHAAADVTEEIVLFKVPDGAPDGLKLDGVDLHFSEAVTGQATNYTNLNLKNRGAAGDGTTELANIDFASGTNASAYVKKAFYAPASALSLVAGAILTLETEKVSNGLALPNFTARLRLRSK